MQLDTFLPPNMQLAAIPEMAAEAEKLGFGAAWVAETQHNPFLACTLIAEHSQRMQFGTAIAVSFARSPAVMAHTAWDLADYSKGRFLLGLGTQVKAHIERRFGMPWPESPIGKLREQIRALHSFWQAWQNGESLNLRGEYYQISLTSPFFSPGAIDHPEIPILIAGVNTGLARLAGEAADGFVLHPYHSPTYLKEKLMPAIRHGAKAADRKAEDIQILVNAFVVTNDTERAHTRRQLSFYASTPSYRPVMALHGWEDIAEELSALAARKNWEDMPQLINDEMLSTFATIAEEADLPAALLERYGQIATRLSLYTPFVPKQRDEFWRHLVNAFNV